MNLARADNPLFFASPVALSFGLVGPTASVTRQVELTDAGGGGDPWTVTLEQQVGISSATISFPPAVTVPGTLPVTVTTSRAPDAEVTGYLAFSRGTEKRRIPYWFRTGAPKLATTKFTPLRRPGSYSSTTKGGASRVSRYLYPDLPAGFGFAAKLPGPERVFRVRLSRPALNFGVAITSRARGVAVEPRIVVAGDERRLTGYPALPYNLNPYLRTFGDPVLASGVILPATGVYDVVFDSPSAARAGGFSFRFWLNDATPPALTLRTRQVRLGKPIVVAAIDRGAGVDPGSLVVTIDDTERSARYVRGQVLIPTAGLSKGRRALRLQVSDFQESRNMENVGTILPNTRILATTFVVS